MVKKQKKWTIHRILLEIFIEIFFRMGKIIII